MTGAFEYIGTPRDARQRTERFLGCGHAVPADEDWDPWHGCPVCRSASIAMWQMERAKKAARERTIRYQIRKRWRDARVWIAENILRIEVD